jgi:hypothetical protein
MNPIENIRSQLEDKTKGHFNIDAYSTDSFNLSDYKLTQVLDDILLVQYVDVSEDGREVMRNGVLVPVDVARYTWRVGKVILAGPSCKTVKQGDYVVFPNDKGIRASNINGLRNVVFLNEIRIFSIVEPIEDSNNTKANKKK